MADESKLLSTVKLDLYWVTFRDKNGRERNRMVFRNPTDKILLWDIGADKSTTIPVGEISFEEAEHLRIERMDNMGVTRCPSWLEEQITKKINETDHFVDDTEQKKGQSADAIREKAEKIAKLDHPSGALGGAEK